MAEYIEREALIEKILSISVTISGRWSGKTLLYEALKSYRETVLEFIKQVPTADVVEVKHGEWLNGVTGYICSVCNKQEPTKRFLYCPNCGADMRGRTNGKK